MRVREFIVEKITVIKFGVDDRGKARYSEVDKKEEFSGSLPHSFVRSLWAGVQATLVPCVETF